jgi:hypothetical protein
MDARRTAEVTAGAREGIARLVDLKLVDPTA